MSDMISQLGSSLDVLFTYGQEARAPRCRGHPGASVVLLLFVAITHGRMPHTADTDPDAGERDFEDLKLLISHQKAKHFKCDRCGRRLNTAGGLSVHLNQVHKETLDHVENALPNRQGLDVEIFGMEGIPADILDQHRNRIIQNFYQAQEDRRAATGNPLPGQAKPPKKKLKMETPEELKARLADHRAKVAAAKAAGLPHPGISVSPAAGAPANASPGAFNNSPYPAPRRASYGAAPADPQFPANAQAAGTVPLGYPQPGFPGGPGAFNGFSPAALPARPSNSSLAAPPGLPQRPQNAGGYYNGGPTGQPGEVGDAIDQIIRDAELRQQDEEERGGRRRRREEGQEGRAHGVL
ncbi:RING-6 [Verticillium alfalfae VaMs.102]|uniref:RING-6 n=1 Tax=Verticillium alfalfae (strain VaMs.102 / ATCC MYA-4576 / FGSC 10136) TaxID=526221 RepID=C9SYD1_VERA1|nr:RING-6 [Verticillium alfalfae VaMs.102]EEY23796.1 RING-6 [Verticillium alfalfae VaMs.102]